MASELPPLEKLYGKVARELLAIADVVGSPLSMAEFYNVRGERGVVCVAFGEHADRLLQWHNGQPGHKVEVFNVAEEN